MLFRLALGLWFFNYVVSATETCQDLNSVCEFLSRNCDNPWVQIGCRKSCFLCTNSRKKRSAFVGSYGSMRPIQPVRPIVSTYGAVTGTFPKPPTQNVPSGVYDSRPQRPTPQTYRRPTLPKPSIAGQSYGSAVTGTFKPIRTTPAPTYGKRKTSAPTTYGQTPSEGQPTYYKQIVQIFYPPQTPRRPKTPRPQYSSSPKRTKYPAPATKYPAPPKRPQYPSPTETYHPAPPTRTQYPEAPKTPIRSKRPKYPAPPPSSYSQPVTHHRPSSGYGSQNPTPPIFNPSLQIKPSSSYSHGGSRPATHKRPSSGYGPRDPTPPIFNPSLHKKLKRLHGSSRKGHGQHSDTSHHQLIPYGIPKPPIPHGPTGGSSQTYSLGHHESPSHGGFRPTYAPSPQPYPVPDSYTPFGNLPAPEPTYPPSFQLYGSALFGTDHKPATTGVRKPVGPPAQEPSYGVSEKPIAHQAFTSGYILSYEDECQDLNGYCEIWSLNDNCYHKVSFMASVCPKACGFC